MSCFDFVLFCQQLSPRFVVLTAAGFTVAGSSSRSILTDLIRIVIRFVSVLRSFGGLWCSSVSVAFVALKDGGRRVQVEYSGNTSTELEIAAGVCGGSSFQTNFGAPARHPDDGRLLILSGLGRTPLLTVVIGRPGFWPPRQGRGQNSAEWRRDQINSTHALSLPRRTTQLFDENLQTT
jgi:hypothetical protein